MSPGSRSGRGAMTLCNPSPPTGPRLSILPIGPARAGAKIENYQSKIEHWKIKLMINLYFLKLSKTGLWIKIGPRQAEHWSVAWVLFIGNPAVVAVATSVVDRFCPRSHSFCISSCVRHLTSTIVSLFALRPQRKAMGNVLISVRCKQSKTLCCTNLFLCNHYLPAPK